MSWTESETSTYQDHVIKHVIGATVLGWFIAADAVHFVLDVGLLWTIYVNAEMNLMALFLAIEDLESTELPRTMIGELLNDAQLLISHGRDATGLKRFTGLSVDCLVEQVHLFSDESRQRVVVIGETARIEIATSISDSSLKVSESNQISA